MHTRIIRLIFFSLFISLHIQAMQCKSLADAKLESKYYKEKYIIVICEENQQKFAKTYFNQKQELVSLNSKELQKIKFALNDIVKMHKNEVTKLCQGQVTLRLNLDKGHSLEFCKQTKLKLFQLFSDLFFTYHKK